MGELKRRVLKLINGGGSNGQPAGVAVAEGRDERDVPPIGVVLRAARTQAGLELRDVATMLKIRYAFMLAIEEGRYQELPGTAYAVGFVRAYSDYLGLDSEAVVRRFKDEVAGKVGRQNLYFPTPVPEGKIPGGTILLFSVILVFVVYGGWYVLSATDRSVVDVVEALPQRLVSLLDVFSRAPTPPKDVSAAAATVTAPAQAVPGAPPADGAGSPASPSATAAPMAEPLPPVLPGGVVPRSSLPPAPPGAAQAYAVSGLPVATEPPSAQAPVAAESADSTDEIPLVSGPADENTNGPGPLVPMAPRVKPAPPPAPGETPVPPPTTALAAAPAAASAPAGSPAAPAAATPSAPPTPVAADPTAGATRVYGGHYRDSRVAIKASQDTWVQVRDASGEAIFTRVLRTGEVFRVPDKPGMRLRTGNAGGLGVIVDGGELQPLGQVGQVLRDVPVDAGRLRAPGALPVAPPAAPAPAPPTPVGAGAGNEE